MESEEEKYKKHPNRLSKKEINKIAEEISYKLNVLAGVNHLAGDRLKIIRKACKLSIKTISENFALTDIN